jgi:hypothetical protein
MQNLEYLRLVVGRSARDVAVVAARLAASDEERPSDALVAWQPLRATQYYAV